MVEDSPPSPGQHEPERTLSASLHAQGQPVRDVAYGDGLSYRLGQPARTHLEFYAEAHVTRVTGKHVQLSLHGVVGIAFGEDKVSFQQQNEDEQAVLTVRADGGFRLTSLPREEQAATRSPKRVAAGKGGNGRPRAERRASGDSAASETASADSSPQNPPEQEEKKRLRLIGRVGTAPRTRTTRNGAFVARFPLAVHNDDASTTWHNVVAFEDRARQAQAELVKGQVVEVIGYVHERIRKMEDGTEKTTEELYAAVIKSPYARR